MRALKLSISIKIRLIVSLLAGIHLQCQACDTIQVRRLQLTPIADDFVNFFISEMSDTTEIRDLVLWGEKEDSTHLVLKLMHLSYTNPYAGFCKDMFVGMTTHYNYPIYYFGLYSPIFVDSIGVQSVAIPECKNFLCQEEWDPEGWRLTIHTDSTICWNRTAKYDIDAPIDSVVSVASKYLKGVSYDKFEANFLSKRVSDLVNVDSLNVWIQPSPFYLSVIGTPISMQERFFLKNKKIVGRINLYVSDSGRVKDYTFEGINEVFHRKELDSLIDLLGEISFEPARIRNRNIGSMLVLSVYE